MSNIPESDEAEFADEEFDALYDDELGRPRADDEDDEGEEIEQEEEKGEEEDEEEEAETQIGNRAQNKKTRVSAVSFCLAK